MRNLQLTTEAIEQLENFKRTDQKLAKRFVRVMDKLCNNPLHGDTSKLTNSSNYRSRIGQYRMIYRFNEDIVEIMFIGHRKDVYRKWERG
ncbi:MAG: type II toxin-antitoxin system RelE/ParE family toxin [Rhodobacteraceae bacterium]|nr:type II toxin-antitoxin system RelE/ParE family toxin [Paracoccaceae bacterium]